MKSKKLSGRQKKIINGVLDQIMDEYAINNKIIFHSESDRAKHQFELVNKRLGDWKKSKQCMVPDCPKQSVKKSHTIPRGMSLNKISENGNLLTPGFDQILGTMLLKPVGVSQASTFPGFCSEHERLFESFETQKKLETDEHIYLQTYRAVCRELFRARHVINDYERLKSSYCRLRDERLREIVRQRAVNGGFHRDTVFESFSLSDDVHVNWWEDKLVGVRRLVSHIQYKVIPALENAVFHGKKENIYVRALNIDLQIPVALSGCAPFFVSVHGLQKEVHPIINVVPYVEHSLLIFACDSDSKEFVQQYITNWTVNAFSIISMIESWMVNGTDQWYMKPSVWNRLGESRKELILDDMLECKQNIGEEYGLSIFDDIRNALLVMLKKKYEPTQDSAYWRFVESQKIKMTQ